MPGSTTPLSSEQPKAKVTDSSAINGIFVRPVAVADLFRPAEEAANKPTLPEKRRFSALAGDLRPCSSSGNGILSDDFARRRQSWDTKVKEVPFGQVLLRKTPRNSNASSSLPVKQDPATNGSSHEDVPQSDKNSHAIPQEKSTETSSCTPNSLASKNISTVVQPPVLKDKLINNDISKKAPGECDNRIAKEFALIKQPGLKRQNHTSGETNQSVNSKNSTGFNLNPPSKVINVSDKFIDKTTIQETIVNKSVNADNSKQPKKIYGIIKRDSKVESSNNAENTSINIERKSQNESPKVERLLLKRDIGSEVPEPISSKTEILSEQTSVNSFDSKKMKVYGLSKKNVTKDKKDKEVDISKQTAAGVTGVQPAPDVAKKTHETKVFDKKSEIISKSSNIDIDKTRESDTANKNTENIALPSKSFDSKRVQPAPDAAKKTHETKVFDKKSEIISKSSNIDIDKTRESDTANKTTENIALSSKSFDSKRVETPKIIDKVNEFQKAQSPPKEFRTVRRTSDVIAAKIQNIFSNISTPEKPPPLLSKKGKNVEKENTNSNASSVKIVDKTTEVKKSEATYKEDGDNQSVNLIKIETKSVVDKKSNNIEIRNSSKIPSKSPLVTEQELKINDKKSDVDIKKEESKYKQPTQTTADRSGLKKENKLASESRDVLQPCKSGEVMTTCELIELPLKKANSEKECSVTAVLSKAQNKKTLNIGGKMPIKQDENNLDCTTSHKASNQDDRKSSDSTVPFRTLKQASNKGLKLKAETCICTGSGEKISSSGPTAFNRVDTATNLKNNHINKTVETSVSVKESNTSQSSLVSQTSNKTFVIEQTKSVKSTFCNGISQSQVKVEKSVKNCIGDNTQVSKIEVAQITPSTVPGIVPTVNVLFRTKSPQSSATKEENRKKVVVETYASSSPIPSAVINASNVSENLYVQPTSSVNESFKEALKTVESVQKSLNSPGLPKKHSIVNLKKEELVSVTLESGDSTKLELKMPPNTSKVMEKCTSATDNKAERSQPCVKQPVKADALNAEKGNTMSSNLESVAKTVVSQICPKPENNDESNMKCEYGTKDYKTDITVRNSIEMNRSSFLDSKTNVVDLGDWNKKFQRTEPEPPRVPLRRRSARESMPPSLPLRSRFGSLKRIDDSPRYVPRSPSQSSLPQRYSYTEMLSKVCSMGVLPLVEPSMSKSYSSSSSQVSELWSELSEEQSTATHASEMLEAETTERMRLEKEVQEIQNRCSQVQLRSEKMEMEMMEARVYRTPELNGDLSEDEDPGGNSSLYKQKYERAVRDMEIMKRRIQQQHEEEIEQKAMLKKASDKRLAEALEDVEEERQVANQWKRKSQKLGSELQDLRLMLEEQMARNGELEKKQRRFDAELSAAQEEIKKERLLREKFVREKEQVLHEKYSLEQDLQAAKLDSDTLHEKITQLNRELDELTLSSKGEEEVTQLKRAKQELERKNRDQEEELEELAAQVSMLEQAKLRLEMSLEKVRQEHRREASVREEEIEEIRASFSKKIKNLEAQLEAEQDERHQLVKQKHELERRLYEIADQPPPQDPEIERRLRRDLKRTKALLRDAQSMLEHTRDGQSGKTVIRQLKNQLEDSEFAKAAAAKARQAVEAELQDCQIQLEEATRTKNEVESRCLQLSREKSAIQTQLEEAEEEMAEVMKKYKAVVAQMSMDQKTLTEQNQQIADLETERQMLKDQLSEVSHKFEHLAGQSEDTHKVHRLDGKVRDLESKLELELTTRSRLEHQISRLKEQNDRAREECDSLRNKELQAQEGVRRLQRQIRDLREDYSALQQKEAEAYRKQHELEMALENNETDLQVTKNDLRLACQRIQDLQSALEDDLDSGTDVPDDSGSDSDESFEMAMMRNYSITPTQRCDSVASNYSYASEGIRSRTSSFTQELSAFSSRNDVEKDLNGFSGVNSSNRMLDIENDETV